MVSQIRQIISTSVRDLLIRLKFYTLFDRSPANNNLIMVISKGYFYHHPGLVDRFKAIIGIAYIAKVNNWNFKLLFDDPFDIKYYLEPNIVDWEIPKNRFSMYNSKFFTYDPFAQIPHLSSNKDLHCYHYLGKNILELNRIDDWQNVWKDLFWDLFKPSAHLYELISSHSPSTPYVSVHLRFANSLEYFEKYEKQTLDPEGRLALIHKCILAIKSIEESERCKTIVFSDSKRFLEASKEADLFVLSTENIGHISYQSKQNFDVYDKLFLDFFMMSNSTKVYSIIGRNLYQSAFPFYASILGGIEFTRINIDE